MRGVFTMFRDPSHAWLRVSFQHLSLVGLQPETFTAASRVTKSGDTFYLDWESGDASAFIKKWMFHFPIPEIKQKTNEKRSQIHRHASVRGSVTDPGF